jgi:hypothetical protein
MPTISNLTSTYDSARRLENKIVQSGLSMDVFDCVEVTAKLADILTNYHAIATHQARLFASQDDTDRSKIFELASRDLERAATAAGDALQALRARLHELNQRNGPVGCPSHPVRQAASALFAATDALAGELHRSTHGDPDQLKFTVFDLTVALAHTTKIITFFVLQLVEAAKEPGDQPLTRAAKRANSLLRAACELVLAVYHAVKRALP